jgi:RNA polymerase sigma-70 factor, ECF subfamily
MPRTPFRKRCSERGGRAPVSRAGPLFRTWLHRIATNICLNALERSPRRILVADVAPDDPTRALSLEERPDLGAPPADLPWLAVPRPSPGPGRPEETEPDAVVTARETIELTFLATIQLLPPKQRAVLLLRDVQRWSANETAALLDMSVASANSALQRASDPSITPPGTQARVVAGTHPTDDERAVLERFIDAHDRADVAAFAALLREDVRQTMPPFLFWFDGRDALASAFARYIDSRNPDYPGKLRLVPTAANRQPAAATYLRGAGDSAYRLIGLNVLDVDDGSIAGITSFGEPLLRRFGLPPTL